MKRGHGELNLHFLNANFSLRSQIVLEDDLGTQTSKTSMLDWLKQRVIAWLLSRTVGKWIAIDRQNLQAEAGSNEWTVVANDLLVKPGTPKYKSFAFPRPRCMYSRDGQEYRYATISH